MKTLITESIKPWGAPVISTIFNCSQEEAPNQYRNLELLCGKSPRINFKYTEGKLEHSSFVIVDIPEQLTEMEIMELIINLVNKHIQK